MLKAELAAHLGYEPHAPQGRNSGNSRNGKRSRKLRTSNGDMTLQVPRDRNSAFHSPLLAPYQTSTDELEDKIIGLYAKGVSTRDIQATLHELYGVEVSAATISMVTDKVWGLLEAWQNRPVAAIYPIVYLDAIHLRREGKVINTAVYVDIACRGACFDQSLTRVEACQPHLVEGGVELNRGHVMAATRQPFRGCALLGTAPGEGCCHRVSRFLIGRLSGLRARPVSRNDVDTAIELWAQRVELLAYHACERRVVVDLFQENL
jgi:hypothetical protein